MIVELGIDRQEGTIDQSQFHIYCSLRKPMLNFKSFQSAKCVLAGIELMHMIRKDQFMMQGCSEMSFADQFYALAGQIRPV